MEGTGASFLLPLQISGFTELVGDYSKKNLAPGSLGMKGLFCPRRLLPWKFVFKDPPKGIQLPCQQISAYKRAANTGQEFSIPSPMPVSWILKTFTCPLHPTWGKSAWAHPPAGPVAFRAGKAASKPSPEPGAAAGCSTEEQASCVCEGAIPVPWQIAETIRNSLRSIALAWQPQNSFHCLVIRQNTTLFSSVAVL